MGDNSSQLRDRSCLSCQRHGQVSHCLQCGLAATDLSSFAIAAVAVASAIAMATAVASPELGPAIVPAELHPAVSSREVAPAVVTASVDAVPETVARTADFLNLV